MLLTDSSNVNMKAKRCQVTYKEFFLICKGRMNTAGEQIQDLIFRASELQK